MQIRSCAPPIRNVYGIDIPEQAKLVAHANFYAIEHGVLEPLDRRVQLPYSCDPIQQHLQNDQVFADRLSDLLRHGQLGRSVPGPPGVRPL